MEIYLEDAIKIATNAPCYNEVKKILIKESKLGNIIVGFHNVAMSTSETYYILLFKNYSKNKYVHLEHISGKFYDYDVLLLSDNKGAVEIRFNYEEIK